jgi:hypothetical protein
MVGKVARQEHLLSLGQFPIRRLTRGELTQFVVVVLLLDGTCPFQYASLSTQMVSTGLSTETLKGL